MYAKYFSMRGLPFSIAPDPRYLYMSSQHQEALAHLLYGVKTDGGFVLLTGEVGTGKTTICRRFLESLDDEIVTAFVIHPTLSVAELLATVCDEFGIRYPKKTTIKFLVDSINAFLLELNAQRKKAILIIDEAQNLSNEVLEQIRLLTNLETNERKLLQIILIGQPELREKLAKPKLRQLAQRIVARSHLDALTKSEVPDYVAHRIAVARGKRRRPSENRNFPALFSRSALHSLYKYSGGIPRLMNLICDRALLGAFVEKKEFVDRATLRKAATEVFGGRLRADHRIWKFALTAAAVICSCLGLLYYFSSGASYEVVREIRRPIPKVETATAMSVEKQPAEAVSSGQGTDPASSGQTGEGAENEAPRPPDPAQ